MYPIILDGTTVQLRELEMGDLDSTLAIVGDPVVTAFLSFNTRTRERQADRLTEDIAKALLEPRQEYRLAIVDRESEVLVGIAQLGLLPDGDSPGVSGEVGVAIRRDHWRHGCAKEAMELLGVLGFDTLGLRRIQARCVPENDIVGATLLRYGFKFEGRLVNDISIDDGWSDSLVYVMLESEYRLLSTLSSCLGF